MLNVSFLEASPMSATGQKLPVEVAIEFQ